MALVRCRECDNQISKKAKTCPSCGAPYKKPTSPITKFLAYLLLLPFAVLFLTFLIGDPKPPTQTPPTTSSITTSTPPNPAVVTEQVLEQIRGYISEGQLGTAISTAEKYDFSQSAELRQLHDDAVVALAAKKQETADRIASDRAAAAAKAQKSAEIQAPDISTDTRENIWVSRGKAAVQAQLKDPSSAQFLNVYFHRGVDGIPMTCGEVNSKNSFGGYGGYQKFVSAGKSELTFLEEEVLDFSDVWNRMCR